MIAAKSGLFKDAFFAFNLKESRFGTKKHKFWLA